MHSRLDALPVQTALAGAHAEAVRRWIEGVAGWQAVGSVEALGLPPVLRIADVEGVGPATDRPLPTVLLVDRDDDPTTAARAGRLADEVLRWPEDRERLGSVAAALVDDGPRSRERPELRVGGAAGGVGTTTVGLALGALAAWHLGTALVLTHGAVPAPLTRRLPVASLGATGVWEAAEPLPGVRGLRAVLCDGPPRGAPVDAGPADAVIRDVGVDEDVDALVVRRDRTGLEALARATAAVTVCVDDGPLDPRAVRRAAAGRRVVTVPVSDRIARAAARQRVPAGLPGTWLRDLRAVLGGGW